MAHLTARSNFPLGETVLRWGFAVACSTFLWAFVSVFSQAFSTAFPVLVRVVGPEDFTSSFTVIGLIADRILLACSSTFVMAALLARAHDLKPMLRALLFSPAAVLGLSFFILPSILLLLGGLGTVVAATYCLLRAPSVFGRTSGKMLAPILLLSLAPFTVLSSLSLLRWVGNLIDGGIPLTDWTWTPSIVLLKLLNMGYWLLPFMFLFLFSAWCVRPMLGPLVLLADRFFQTRTGRSPRSDGSEQLGLGVRLLFSSKWPFYLLFTGMISAVFVGVYPYLPMINRTSTLVGFDVRWFYFDDLLAMLNLDPSHAIGFAFKNDRAGMLLLQYGIAGIVGSADLAVRIIPALLAVLLALTTYYFVRFGFGNRELAATASLIAPFSFMVVGGINGGLDAAWLAASEALAFLTLLTVGMSRKSRKLVALSLVPSLLLPITHPWTWLFTLAVIAVYGFLTFVYAYPRAARESLRFDLASVGSVLLANLGAGTMGFLLGSRNGFQVVYASVVTRLDISNPLHVLNSLQLNVGRFLGGALDSPLLVIFAILGVVALPSFGNRTSRLLVAWLMVGLVGILFSSLSIRFFHARFILLLPTQVLAAIGFYESLKYTVAFFVGSGTVRELAARGFTYLAYLAFFATLASIALQNVGFLWTGT